MYLELASAAEVRCVSLGELVLESVANSSRADESRLKVCRKSRVATAHRFGDGNAVLTQTTAWSLYDSLLKMQSITFAQEPAGLERVLRRLSGRDEASPKRWQDDYLVAFAEAANLKLVTFDKAMASRSPGVFLLTP